MQRKMCIYKCMLNVYKNQQNRQTGSRNLMGLKTIWGTYMKLVTKYQISAINSCWEKCDEKCAYMFNVYKNQLSRQTGSRNLTGPKTLPTIWYTYMMRLGWRWCGCVLMYCSLFRNFTFYTPAPQRGTGVYCFTSVRPSKIFFVAFFSVTVDGRNLVTSFI
jgi:hypothetical protein